MPLCESRSVFRCCVRCHHPTAGVGKLPPCRTSTGGAEVGERPPVLSKRTSLMWDRLQVWATSLIQPTTGTLADCSCPGGDLVEVSGGLLCERLYQQGGGYISLRMPSFLVPGRLAGACTSRVRVPQCRTGSASTEPPLVMQVEQESPAIADKPARRESLPKIAPIRRAYNVVADDTGLSSFVWLLLRPKSAKSREIH